MKKLYFIFHFVFILNTGCASSIKFLYNKADTLAFYFVDSYFDLNYEQKDFVKKKLKELHNWHRKEQLPLYVKTIRKLRTSFVLLEKSNNQNSLNSKYVLQLAWEDIKQYQDYLFAKMYPDGVTFLLSLEDSQIEYLEKKIGKRNEKIKDKLKEGIEAFHEKRNKRLIEQTEKWVGSLEEYQILKLTPTMKSIYLIENERIRFGEERKTQILLALKERKDKPNALDFLIKNWCLHYTHSLPKYFLNATENYASSFINFVSAVWDETNDKQKKYFIDKLGYYEDILLSLCERELVI